MKNKPKLTPWFPFPTKPVRIGGYIYRYKSGYEFDAWWDGKKWTINDKQIPSCNGGGLTPYFGQAWRGLAAKP